MGSMTASSRKCARDAPLQEQRRFVPSASIFSEAPIASIAQAVHLTQKFIDGFDKKWYTECNNSGKDRWT